MLTAPSPFSFILFGASGHLAKLKIYPALYTLALKKRFPKDYAIVGFSRTEMTEDAFKELVKQSIIADFEEVNAKVLEEFLSHVVYHQGQYDSLESFKALHERLQKRESGWGKNVTRLAYLSIPPVVFNAVLHNLCESGVHGETAFRCIVEKPVGHDVKSFEKVQSTLMSCFAEEEIYLLDRFLILRFASMKRSEGG